MTTDASAKNFPKPEAVLCLENVLDIEKNLDSYEMVCFVI